MQLRKVQIILFLLSFLFSTISSFNEQLSIVKKCLPSENFMDIAYIINKDLSSDQQLYQLATNLGENMTTFQIKRLLLLVLIFSKCYCEEFYQSSISFVHE
jgi:hypothetical protein